MIQLTDCQIYFSPEDDTQGEFLALLDGATGSIHLADYSFNIPQVVDVLVKKHLSGLDVKLVLDNSQSKGSTEIPEIQQLRDNHVPTVIVESIDHKIEHDKFTVIDNIAQAGSWNYTTTASKENNFYFVFNNSAVSQAFEQAFQKLFNGQTTIIKETIN